MLVKQGYRNRVSTFPALDFYCPRILSKSHSRAVYRYLSISYLLSVPVISPFCACSVVIKGLTVTVDLKLSVKDKKLYVSDLVLHAHVKALPVSLSSSSNRQRLIRSSNGKQTENGTFFSARSPDCTTTKICPTL